MKKWLARFLALIMVVTTTNTFSLSAYAVKPSVTTISKFDNVSYAEPGNAPVKVAPNITLTDASGFSDESSLKFSITGATEFEQLGVETVADVNSISTVLGEVSVLGDSVYMGDGIGYNEIGYIDTAENGQNGNPLTIKFKQVVEKITFDAGSENTNLEENDLIGWTINHGTYDLTAGINTRSNGGTLAIDGTGPYTVTGTSIYDGYEYNTDFDYSSGDPAWLFESVERPFNALTTTVSVVTDAGGADEKAVKLTSDGEVVNNNDAGGVVKYGSHFGPVITSDPFEVTRNSTLSVDWKAQVNKDHYEVYAYAQNVAAGTHELLFYGRGENQDWTTSTTPLYGEGQYRLIIINGSYDKTGDFNVGSNLWVSNSKIYKNYYSDLVATSIAKLVTYSSTDQNSDATRDINLTVTNKYGQVSEASAAITIVSIALQQSTLVNSDLYTVSRGQTANETISDVEAGTSKADLLSALTKGNPNQVWDDSNIGDTVSDGDTLLVVSADTSKTTTYTVCIETAFNCDISEGNITISNVDENTIHIKHGSGDSQTIGENLEKTQTIRITGSTEINKIVVTGTDANIKLDGVEIQLANGCAFELQNNANITLKLAAGTENHLVSSYSNAGLQVETGNTISIQGSGTLIATGGNDAAGIGAGFSKTNTCGDITIDSGTIIATGNCCGAGIGGGYRGSGGNTTINGGTITAIGSNGAGIGGGAGGSAGTVTIHSPATVKAYTYNSAVPAIWVVDNKLDDASTASLILAKFASDKFAGDNISVYSKSLSSLSASCVTTRNCSSIAFTVPAGDTYTIKAKSVPQQYTDGSNVITEFVVSGTGISLISNLVDKQTSSNADLSSLQLSGAVELSPVFESDTISYTASVANNISSLTVTPVVSDSFATVKVNTVAVTSGQASAISLNVGSNTITIEVTAEDGTTAKTYTIIATRAASTGGGSSTDRSSSPGSVVEINGQKQDAGSISTQKSDGKTVTIVTVDDSKLAKLLDRKGTAPTVTLPVNTAFGTVIGELNGQTVKSMEQKDATLEIKTETASYTLPASQINIYAVSSQIGEQVALKDIKVSVKIAEPPADTVKIVENTAAKSNYQIVVKPVEFEITCTSGEKTVEVSKFNGYVERTVAIPDGIDSSKITTGIVLNKDGTFSHVPTQIVVIDGKHYAKINSLTNSTYSVIYNPVEFTDVENHWAKTAINDMGSRMVVSGTGNSTYEPDRGITRAEFSAIVIRAMGLREGTAESSFEDVTQTDWFNGYVDTATAYGLINGYSGTEFGPNNTITREQAIAIIARAMKTTGLNVNLTDGEVNAILEKYTDGASVSDYAKAAVAACVKSGIVSGTGEFTLSPKAYVTRAEVAVMIRQLLQKSGLI